MHDTDTLEGFLESYASGAAARRIVADIDVPDSAAQEDLSPFIIVRYRGRVMILNPMGLTDHLCVDAHTFVDGEKATAGVFTLSNGARRTLEPTGTTSHRWPSADMVALLVGVQGTEPS